jgi:AsmA protein
MELKIVGGQVTIIHGGERRKPSIYSDVNLTASDLSYTSSFPFSLTASLPGSGTVKLEGKAGPLDSQDMLLTPLTADLEVKQFNLIASGFVAPESGLAGIIDFNGNVASQDGQVRSKGQASADKLQVVKSGSPAGQPVSIQYAVDYNLVHQSGNLRDATIGYGKAIAHLNGNYEVREGNLVLKMMLDGTNMPVQDLAALLPAMGITLPKGASLQGGILNTNLVTEGPIDKMVTTGTVDISRTRLVGFDLSGKMSALATLAGLRSTKDTEIEKFASELTLSPEGIQTSNLLLIVPAIGELGGNGRIAGDQSLDFVMSAMLKPGGTLGTSLARLVKGGALNVPFFIRGTASDPKFIPDTKRAAGSLFGSALGQGTKGGEASKGNALGNTLRNLFQKKK